MITRILGVILIIVGIAILGLGVWSTQTFAFPWWWWLTGILFIIAGGFAVIEG